MATLLPRQFNFVKKTRCTVYGTGEAPHRQHSQSERSDNRFLPEIKSSGLTVLTVTTEISRLCVVFATHPNWFRQSPLSLLGLEQRTWLLAAAIA